MTHRASAGYGESGGAPYGEVSEKCVCGAKITLHIETRDGGLVEEACTCGSCGLTRAERRIGGVRHLTTDNARTLTCQGCGRPFSRAGKRGRPPRLGPCCKR